jgi:endonuclease/exonuclease/phosphatase family metal-dependent hydrolase
MNKFLLLALLIATQFASAQNLRIITYNIRYNNPEDGVNAWPNRANHVAALLRFHEADVFGLQEALYDQIEDLQTRLPGFKWIGAGRDDGEKAGEFSPVFYDAKKLTALKSGWFWLSETPDKPGLGWDAVCNRICTWAILKDNSTQQQILFLNTHLDHKGTKARVESANLILRKIKELNTDNLPVILTGDFNLTPEEEPVKLVTKVLNDARAVSSEMPYGPSGTFNNFDFNSPLKDRIDYIFVSRHLKVKQYGILSDSKDQRYFSDHLPVFVLVSFE